MTKIKNIFTGIVFIAIFLGGCESTPPLAPFNSGLPPAVPENIKVTTASDGVIILRWWENIDPEFSSYRIYRNVNAPSGLTFYKEIRTNFFRDEGLYYDSTYYYAVTSVGRNGLESKMSLVANAKPLNNFDPVLPSYIVTKPVNFEGKPLVTIEWSKDDNPDLKGLEVYRSVSQGFNPGPSDLVTVLDTLTDTDSLALSTGVNYYYRFRVADKGGRFSPFSDERRVFLYPPVSKIFPVNDAALPLFDAFSIQTVDFELDYGIILYESPTLSEVWRSPVYRASSKGELYIPFVAAYIGLNKKYYWRVVAYMPGESIPVIWSGLSSFQLTRFN